MPAIFPGSVRVFTTKVDLVDTVMASHVNLLQDEVTSVQTTLGTSLLSSTWSGTYSNTTSHINLSTRLINIEAGVKAANTNLAAISGTVVGTTDSQTLTGKTINGSSNTITNVAQASVTNLGSDLALKAPVASPTFTGTVTLPTTTSIGSVSAAEIGYVDGVTSSIQTQLNTLSSGVSTKAPTASPTFTGTVVLPAATSIGNVSAVELGYVDGVTSSIQTQLNLRAALASPTFTGTVILPATTSIGSVTSTQLGFVTGVTSSIQTQLNTKAPTASPTFTGTVTVVSPTATGSTGARQITVSTADPSGGSDGDLWIKYV